MLWSRHTALLDAAVGVGRALIVILAVAWFEQVPAVAISVYVPLAARLTLNIVGFC